MNDDEHGKVVDFPNQNSKVNHPQHYCDGGIETIDFIRAKLGVRGFLVYCIGNVIKYLSRAGKKDDLLQDLQKAQNYLDWAVMSAEDIYEKQTE